MSALSSNTSQAVLRELDGLKRNPMLGHLARAAFTLMERAQSGSPQLGWDRSSLMVVSSHGGRGKMQQPAAHDDSRNYGTVGPWGDDVRCSEDQNAEEKSVKKREPTRRHEYDDNNVGRPSLMRLQREGEVGARGEIGNEKIVWSELCLITSLHHELYQATSPTC